LILPDSIILRGVSLCRFWLFGLSRHLCHYFVTSRQLRHRARLRIVIRVRVPHGRVDGRMPQQFFHRHEVNTGARQP